MSAEEIARQAEDLASYEVIPPRKLPPYMRVKPFLRFWPMSRTWLFEAIKRKRFKSFVVKDGITKQGLRIIDVKSALDYLQTLSDEAAREGEGTPPALTELKLREQARGRRQARSSGSKATKSPGSRAKQRQ